MPVEFELQVSVYWSSSLENSVDRYSGWVLLAGFSGSLLPGVTIRTSKLTWSHPAGATH